MNIYKLIKKLSLFIVLTLMPVVSMAQVAVGGWKMYTPFTGVEAMAETKTYVYFVSGGAVFRIDKTTQEYQTLNGSNSLNDNDVSGIYADASNNSVIVTYSSGNMDRLFDNGKILNLPDIKDAQGVTTRTINDIAFNKEKFYVATDFGLVTYSNSKSEVIETAFMPNAVNFVGASNAIVALYSNQMVYVAPTSQRLKKITDLNALSNIENLQDVKALDVIGGKCIYMYKGNNLFRITLEGDDYLQSQISNYFNVPDFYVTDLYNSQIYKINDTLGYCYNAKGLFTFDAEGEVKKLDNITFEKDKIYLYKGNLASVWVGSSDGVCEMNLTTSPATALTGNFTGSDLLIKEVQNMVFGPDGKLYLNLLYIHGNYGIETNPIYPARVLTFKDGVFTDVTPYNIDNENNSRKLKEPITLFGTFRIAPDPDDVDAYYIGTYYEGIYHIKNKKQLHKYYQTSAGFTRYDNWSCLVYDVDVDKYGNLWTYVCATNNNDSYNRVFVLPAEKRTKATTTPADWRAFSLPGVTFDLWCASVLACKEKSSRVVIAHGRQSKNLFVVDNKNTASVTDDRVIVVDTQIDQDGKIWPKTYGFNCMVEDKEGKVWVGTDVGVFEIPDVDVINSSTISIRRQKIPRNDGTNLADYLLDNVNITSMAVDASNRKWIATNGSGVYLVSPEGDEILEHYTSDKSILPTNKVYAVACDPNSNKVYFGTPNGLVEYSSTSAPGAENYDDVYAFPNPVRPDYGGWITVTGLMDNSLVKIADAYGNVFHQGKSDGGMFVWDGCNASGERVKTGVYYVLASQNATGQSEACVTKIMVIN